MAAPLTRPSPSLVRATSPDSISPSLSLSTSPTSEKSGRVTGQSPLTLLVFSPSATTTPKGTDTMGLRVSVYRQAENEFSRSWPCDTTNGGITSRYSALCVDNAEGPFEPDAETPAVMLVPGNLAGTVILVPAVAAAPQYWVPVASNTQEYAGPM